MTEYQPPGTTIAEGMATVARLTGIPLDDVIGFVILCCTVDEETAMIHNCGTQLQLAQVLADQLTFVLYSGEPEKPRP